MKPILMIGSTVVTLALLFYSIGIITEQRKKVISKKVLLFLTLGLISDITATACMIIGSSNSPFTFHGFIGYAALLAMIIETTLAYRFNSTNGASTQVTKGLHLYSRFAYVLWVAVYITGSLLVVFK
jgi:uncharacterized repeat protein (TIGR03987 family)